MSKALNLSLLASRNNLGNAGDAFTSTGPDTVPNLSPLSARVTQLNGTNIIPNGTIGVNRSTGNVTISATPSLSELDVPGWDKGQHITQWSTLQYYLSATAYTNRKIPASSVYVEVFGTVAGGVPLGPASESGVLAPNGKIYLIPRNGSLLNVIDPATNTVSVINSTFPGGAAFYTGGVLAPNGKIYLNQAGISVGRVIDPSTNTVSTPYTFSGITTSLNGQFVFVVAPNGKLYGMPITGNSLIRVVDPSNDTATNIVTLGSSISGGSAVLAPNGKIYFTATGTNGYAFDPSNNSITTLTKYFGGGQGGAAVDFSGYIVSLSGSGTAPNLLKYNPNDDTATTISLNPGPTLPSGSWGFAIVVAPNGKLYFPPHDATIGFVLDMENYRLTTYGNNTVFPGSQAFGDGIFHPNGKIYFFPYNSTSVVAISILNNNNWNTNVCTNPFYNRY